MCPRYMASLDRMAARYDGPGRRPIDSRSEIARRDPYTRSVAARPVTYAARRGPMTTIREEAGVPEIEAHITGTVGKIECRVGDEIAEGDTVVVLESMKMEMPVEAEDRGTVRAILCEEGQRVHEGDSLVVLE